jgi:hypothetical protein
MTGIAGSNLAEDLEIRRFCLLSVVLVAAFATGPITLIEESFRVCVCVCVCVCACVILCHIETLISWRPRPELVCCVTENQLVQRRSNLCEGKAIPLQAWTGL